jgi:hypothetical protein
MLAGTASRPRQPWPNHGRTMAEPWPNHGRRPRGGRGCVCAKTLALVSSIYRRAGGDHSRPLQQALQHRGLLHRGVQQHSSTPCQALLVCSSINTRPSCFPASSIHRRPASGPCMSGLLLQACTGLGLCVLKSLSLLAPLTTCLHHCTTEPLKSLSLLAPLVWPGPASLPQPTSRAAAPPNPCFLFPPNPCFLFPPNPCFLLSPYTPSPPLPAITPAASAQSHPACRTPCPPAPVRRPPRRWPWAGSRGVCAGRPARRRGAAPR